MGLARKKFNEDLIKRLKRLREEAGLTQEQMASRLGIPWARYQKYEVRSALPAYLIPLVCEILKAPAWYLLTGRFAEYMSEPPPERPSTPSERPLRRAS